MQSGYEFLGTVIAAGILGYGLDYVLGTLPWGMILMLVFGFVSATWRAQKMMNKKEHKKN